MSAPKARPPCPMFLVHNEKLCPPVPFHGGGRGPLRPTLASPATGASPTPPPSRLPIARKERGERMQLWRARATPNTTSAAVILLPV
jgi:hypothetical protein